MAPEAILMYNMQRKRGIGRKTWPRTYLDDEPGIQLLTSSPPPRHRRFCTL